MRLQCDHVNRSIIPAFYRYLQAQEIDAQIESGKEFLGGIETLITLFERAEKESEDRMCGLWNKNGELSLADVLVAPCMFFQYSSARVMQQQHILGLFRATNALKHYRGFSFPPSKRFSIYLDKLLQHPAFKMTCSTEQLYLDSYERYADRPACLC